MGKAATEPFNRDLNLKCKYHLPRNSNFRNIFFKYILHVYEINYVLGYKLQHFSQ